MAVIQKPPSVPTILGIDEVLKLFPVGFKPSKSDLIKTVEDIGCYHDLWGKKAFTEDDVDELMEYMRAKPKSPEMLAKLGPGRLFNLDAPKNTDGLMVVIGDQLGGDETIFIGWAPEGAVGDLLLLVQFGNPYNLGCLGWYPATVADVDAHHHALRKFQYRTDDSNWYMRSKQVNAYLQQLRDNVYGPAVANEGDDD